jgi:hypothetical protein
VACPFFMPVQKLDNGSWPHAARLPLGCGWTGHCTAPGHEDQTPTQDVIESFCNLGYASKCSWTPPQRSWDAVRFAVASPSDSQKRDTGSENPPSETLRLIYVCERDHLPVCHGELQFDLAQANWSLRHEDLRVQKMAECFLESYLKKKA